MTPTKAVYPTTVDILNQEIDCEGNTPGYYRILVNKKHLKYITIEPKIYETDDLCFPPVLLSKLPPFPAGDWNCDRISQAAENPTTFFAETSRKDFPSVTPLWHAKSYDYLSVAQKAAASCETIGQRLRANVYVASSSQFKKPIIAKLARFEWKIGYYITETQVYSWIDGSNISPEFLGYLTEEGRDNGFLIENVEGRHATTLDLPACKAVVGQLHGLGILHGNLNKHNFLISERGAVFIDFETAKRSDDGGAMDAELRGLEEQLLDESGIGVVVLDEEEKI